MPGASRLKRIVALIVAVLALALGLPAQAQTGLAGAPLATCIAPVRAGVTAARVFAGAVPLDCDLRQYRHGAGDYWALSAPIPTAIGRAPFDVRILSLWQDGLTLHALYGDGKIATITVDGRGIARHVRLGAILSFAVPARAAPAIRLLWHVRGAANVRGVLLDQRLASRADGARSDVLMAAVYSGFAGLALALLVYNFSLWGALRYRFQLIYCAMVAALLVYSASSSGALAWWVTAATNNDRIRVNYLMLGLSAAAALLFARAFFEQRVMAGWLGRTTIAAAALAAVVGIGFVPLSAIAMPLADALFSWGLMAALAVAGPILWRAWWVGSRYLWLFAGAWAVPLGFAIARTLAALHIVPSGFWLDNSTVLSMALEALLSSLAIAYRVQMLRAERDEAVAGETVARRLADIDPLTGLLNRRSFLTQAIGRPTPQTLHLIDIDHFKAINETLGHDGGDEVLRVFARALRQLAPPGVLIARLGGEEFALLADAGTPIDGEQILAVLRAARMPFDLAVTSSIGSCAGPLGSEADWKALYRSADRALFEAKAAGRDRARSASPLAIAA